VLELLPQLAERRNPLVVTLSRDEQHMVVIGRALMGFPRMLLRDEPSGGLYNILVDTCCGNGKWRTSMLAWHMLNTLYLDRLASLSLRPEDIDVVLCTRLHADHVGWNTKLLDGRWGADLPQGPLHHRPA
jgi:glyoxylase-like metal-dependent hydrolase (beta-lactamase superfamily II)